MEQLTVRWHGHACFSLTCRDFTVVLDPYEDHYVPGFPPLRLTGDLVLCSHQHNDHHPGLVPDAGPGGGARPRAPAGRGSAAADPVQRHAGGPRHNKPAQPAERCRERPAHRRHNGLGADKQISFLH